jgi:hypothetical protein
MQFMHLIVWLPALFLLGIAAFAAICAFLLACNKV